MEIKVGYGCCNIFFGMSEKEVIGVLGQPNKKYIRDIAMGYISKVYQYNDFMIMPVFDEDEGFRLYTIEVYHPNMSLFNYDLYNKDMDEVTSFLYSKGYIPQKNESYELFDVIFCEDINMEFIFEFNNLVNIRFSPLFLDNDNIVWPNSLYE